MYRKFSGVKLGRSDFEEFNSLIKSNFDSIKVRVDNHVSNSLFDPSLSEATRDFAEILFTVEQISFELEINEHHVNVSCRGYDIIARGLYEIICDKLDRKQSVLVRISRDMNLVWFNFDVVMLLTVVTSSLAINHIINFYSQLVIFASLYAPLVILSTCAKIFSKNKLSVISNTAKRRPISSLTSGIVSSLLAGIIVLILTNIVDYAKIKHVFGFFSEPQTSEPQREGVSH